MFYLSVLLIWLVTFCSWIVDVSRSKKKPTPFPWFWPRGSLYCLRAVLFDAVYDWGRQFKASSQSDCRLFYHGDNGDLGMMLEAESRTAALDGYGCTLSDASWKALQAVNHKGQAALAVRLSQKFKPGKESEATAGSFTRSRKGRAEMVQQVKQHLWLDAVKLWKNPIVEPDSGRVRLHGVGQLTSQELLSKAPGFFESFFVDTRNAQLFSVAIFEWILKCRTTVEYF